ncbi:Stress response protein nst1 [Penicillium rubens]|uniref:Stress response protein NST1 n=1 Tax=Penicillium chrysogenum TaxID=5076 RepID=A0A167XTV3_PENCH|nr:Stress response protein nst1 [Penicillium rubens]KAJ5045943.1 Stress response protein nst1 [Penicillium rubens]KZN93199.1 Stress response protein [Penicillium chrysogenum]
MATHMSATPLPSTNGQTHARGPQGATSTGSAATSAPSVNRKKQKRRQKQAARLAAEHPDAYAPGDADSRVTDEQRSYNEDHEYHLDDHSHTASSDHYGFAPPEHPHGPTMNGPDGHHAALGETSKRKKNKKARSSSHNHADRSATPLSNPSATFSHPPPPPQSMPYISRFTGKPMKNSSIWNQSTLEERENIRTFWFELGEEERRQLVKVEKDAVLKKMKEQQKHSCSCTVCGRKRTAIEEELEVLYDAYYEELEQYANNNQGAFDEGAPIIPPPRLYQPPLRAPGQHTRTHGQFHPSRSRVQELPEDDDDLEEDYDEEEEEEDDEEDEDEEEDDEELYSDEDLEDDEARAARADFFAFGNSLTVKDGILTVADDLLKNDGKHFIDMMEQLAERRMQREEDTQYGMAAAHQSFHGHNHGPLDDEDYDDEEDDEDYDSQEEEEFDEDEMDAMTEEQRMQEGRRMFQIFAARMFEQRVMTAYREKVAEQRQKQLIDELLQEETLNEQRNAKKAREAQKKKDKKRLQKQAKEEEKARRDAEKAAEEAAAKAAQEKKLEEQRLKREEQRKKREAERKAQEEERARKEAEKQRRLKEERERQAEAERKQREQKEEKKRREEAKRKEKEEREATEKKAKEERDRKMREEQARKDRDAAREQEIRDRSGKREQVRTSPPHTLPGVIPYNLQSQAPPGFLQSPHYPTATPIVPKVSTPGRPRQQSHHGSSTSSPHSQPNSADSSHHPSISPRSMGHSQSGATFGTRQGYQQPPLHHPQPSAPLSPLGRTNPSAFSGLGGLPFSPPGIPGMAPRSAHPPESMYSSNAGMMNPLRPFNGSGGIPAPPGMNGVRPMPPSRAFPPDSGHGLPFAGNHGVPGAFPLQQAGLSKVHSRQPSLSFDRSPLESGTQPFPITRPSPIKRPSSSAQDRQNNGNASAQQDVDGLSAHLGSSALLDDTDATYPSNLSQSLPGAPAPGPFPGPTRASFQGSSLFSDPLGSPQNNLAAVSPMGNSTWGAAPFGGSAFPSTWRPAPAGTGWPPNNAFAAGGHHRPHTSRPVTIRLLVIQACKHLNSMTSPQKGAGSFHDVNLVLGQVEQLRNSGEPSISLDEMLDICDTEGSPQNGGGSFSIKEGPSGKSVRFEPDPNSAASGHRGSIVPGDIGSPVPSNSHPAPFSGFGGPSVLRQYASPPTGLFGGTSLS